MKLSSNCIYWSKCDIYDCLVVCSLSSDGFADELGEDELRVVRLIIIIIIIIVIVITYARITTEIKCFS